MRYQTDDISSRRNRPALSQLIQLFFTGVLLTISAQASTESDQDQIIRNQPVPGWVVDTPWQQQPLRRKQPVQFILSDSQTRVTDAAPVYFYRAIEKALSADGVDQVSKIEIGFNPVYQQLAIHKLSVIRNGQSSDRAESALIRIIEQEDDADRNIYDGRKTALILLNDIRKNDILEFSYSITGFNPVLGKRFFGYRDLGWSVTVDQQQIRYLMPKQRPLQYQSHKLSTEPKISQLADGYTEYLWTNDKTPIIRHDDQYPPGETPYPWLSVSEYDSWKEVNQWALDLYQDKYTGGQRFQQLVKQLNKDFSTPKAYTEAALASVQEDIRYLGLEFGESSHRPNMPEQILQNRYGDCKDKAVLLTALLRARGIDAWPALVSFANRGTIDSDLPSPGAFDHVITLVELEGEQYWLDGTRINQGTDINRLATSRFGKALVLRPGTKALSDVEPRNRNKITVSEHVVISDYQQPVAMTLTTVFEGSEAEWQRNRLANADLEQVSENYLDYFSDFYPMIELADTVSYTDNRLLNRLTITEKYRIPEYWLIEDKVRSASFYTTGFYSHAVKPDRLRRNGSYWPGSKAELQHNVSIHFPEPLKINMEGWHSKISSPYFAYETDAEYQGKTLTVFSTLNMHGKPVPAKEAPKYARDMAKVQDAMSYSFQFEDPLQSTRKQREDLLSRLEMKLEEALKGSN
ncbi:DUF3857 domain-containing transglutaminase family protein [Spongorhabdus nitratireducens]